MRVYQRGKRWWVDFSYNGKRIRRSAGRTKREALLKLGEIQRRIEQEDQEDTPAVAPRSFSEFAKEYLEYAKAHKRPSSYRRDVTSLNQLLVVFGSSKLTEITTRTVERFQINRSAKVSPATVNRDMETLKHMLKKAMDWGYLKMNPAQRVKPLKTPPSRIRFLSLEERELLLAECSKNPMLWAIVFTALETGMRKGELADLTWKDINFERRSIRLMRTKNNESRTVPISDRLLPVLERLYVERSGGYVFSKPDGSPYGNWRKAFENACKRAGIEDFRFHDLRHTFASYLVMAGVDIRTVQELMGHKDIKMTMRYSHLSQSHLLEAVNRIGTNMAQNGSSPSVDFAKLRS